jgi:sugar lactone lactonase YvrE
MVEVELLWDAQCPVSESPVWDAALQRVWFCDIYRSRILAYDVMTGDKRDWLLSDWVGSFGLCRSGRLVVALRHHVVLFDPATGKSEDFAQFPDEPAMNRLNDGKVGPDGCFWVGSMDTSPVRQPTGRLYRLTPDGSTTCHVDGIMTSNGLAWSPDGRTMFHSDSRLGRIDAWDFDANSGTVSNRRTIAISSIENGRPDGAACDSDGNYWSAGPSAGCVNCWSPTGDLLEKIDVSLSAPTMPCFGDGYMYLTSMRRNQEEEKLRRCPTLGGLHRMPTKVRGATVGKFAD